MLGKIIAIFTDFAAKVREINLKYSKPRIIMTPWVKLALLCLRFYLVALVLIMGYKFFTLIR